ncbi:MAG: hypothetical protein KC656_31635, partial [Myxococcales bacterium]|nr:hypothetical protein [Myxococcales bacterium]
MRLLRPFAWLGLLVMLPQWASAAFSDHMAVPDDIGRNKVPRDGVRPVLVLRLEVGEHSEWG